MTSIWPSKEPPGVWAGVAVQFRSGFKESLSRVNQSGPVGDFGVVPLNRSDSGELFCSSLVKFLPKVPQFCQIFFFGNLTVRGSARWNLLQTVPVLKRFFSNSGPLRFWITLPMAITSYTIADWCCTFFYPNILCEKMSSLVKSYIPSESKR